MAPRHSGGTGKRRPPNISYNLSSADAREAFEQELDLEDDAARRGRGTQAPRHALSLRSDLHPLHQPDFEGMQEYDTPQHTKDMVNLLDIFGNFDRELIESVYFSSGSRFELAMQRLMELGGPGERGGSSEAGGGGWPVVLARGAAGV
ncbi:hypothetical protein TSOC_010036 [Tetrabaena socialis]|uniref:Uncharacterized protein n=1 Tax=Tetrabaena socialis TaxID=47790 RepID=A0A2J7ZUB2_9CHLO|nr:hypothetical protein TSOC_010036 [Tetrabaena socialis]|eukprot:PNH03865.1 hypothetical protein TSOC_010036 [Tetrabaena socialis]